MDIEITNIAEKVVNHLRFQIISGILPSGQKLNEVNLSESLGISRIPLREALRILENEHLIVSMPRKGSIVKKISLDDLREIYQTRMMIESYAIDLLRLKKIDDLSKLELSLQKAFGLPVPSADSPEEFLHYMEVFADYHTKLVETTGNNRIVQFYRTISSNLKRYQFLALLKSNERSLQFHQEILSLLKKKAHASAKKIMLRHINESLRCLEKKIRENGVPEEK
jgi:DNA-binding GntR family transcriptional regulator